jgi:hypothetical protein
MSAWNLQKIGCGRLGRVVVGFLIGVGQLDPVVALQESRTEIRARTRHE